ncbi:MAG: hypothetical protein RSG77_03030 [Hafnia sp.]
MSASTPKISDESRKKDSLHYVTPAQRQIDKRNIQLTKTALHRNRTRLRVLDRENFSVLFFYKPIRQPAPPLAFCEKAQTEKIEKDFSFFQFFDLAWIAVILLTH